MKIVFFTFYFTPDLSAGSFRAESLVRSLEKKLPKNIDLHVITTQPNRYKSSQINAKSIETNGKITIHRIHNPLNLTGKFSHIKLFLFFSFKAFMLCKKIKPIFIIGTSSRLMTGLLTFFSARVIKCDYFIDIRDIFSETISDIISQKSKVIGSFCRVIFFFLEKQMLTRASGVNIVSEGFFEYYKAGGIDTSKWTFFPNGVDNEFVNFPLIKQTNNKILKIVYAGNIGTGQGLERVIPSIAEGLGHKYLFRIIGDGSTMHLLRNTLKIRNISNVELIQPVSRKELINFYKDADFLFLHLNDISAFKRVLPSKLFEYASIGKPIIAGLSGYSAKFIELHIPYALLFKPLDSKSAIKSIKSLSNYQISEEYVRNFNKLFSREEIMNQMSDHLIKIMKIK